MKLPLPEAALSFARALRGQQTSAEETLWYLLRDRRFCNLKFRRQHAVPPYVLDFYCAELKLAVELDGSQHNADTGIARDARRDALLRERGIATLRYWNHDVLQRLESVLEHLLEQVQRRAQSLTPTPLPEGEGKQSRHSSAGARQNLEASP